MRRRRRLPLFAAVLSLNGLARHAVADAHSPRDDRPAAKSPAEALASMRVRAGFQVEQVVCEPMTTDPVSFAWGPDGKFWVVEMGDYPLGVDGNGGPGGVVRFLTDDDGDGKYDRSTVFLDKLSFPTGVTPWRNGVIVTAAPDVFYAEDTDGDGKADRREVLFTGFGEGNQQHRVNGLVYGLDNWFYGANGESGGRVKSLKTGKTVDLGRGKDFRCRPETGEIEPETAGTQFGRTRDDWGNWFGCNNSNPNYHFVLAERYLTRNARVGGVIEPWFSCAQASGAAAVFPASKLAARFNDFDHAGRITSANSVCVYRDDLFGPAFAGNSFVSEPVHNLVHREVMEPHGVTFRSERAADERASEFLASTDNWFRPTKLRTGPDGALWVADMYREVIEHPEWIPPAAVKKLDLRAGHDKGRVYRVFPAGVRPRPIPRLDRLDAAGLVAALDSPSGWQRDAAQQLLVERQDKSAVPLLEAVAAGHRRPLARLHALCTLDGLGALRHETLLAALRDPHPGVVRQAILLCEPRLDDGDDLIDALARLTGGADAPVRLQLALTLGARRRDQKAVRPLAALVDGDLYVTAGVVSSLRPEMVRPFVAEVRRASRVGMPIGLAAPVAQMAAEARDGEAVADVFALVAGLSDDGTGGADSDVAATADLLDALDSAGYSLATLAAEGPARAGALRRIEPMFVAARQTAADASAASEKRAAAVRLLYRGPDRTREDLSALVALLGPKAPPEVRSAAVESLGRIGTPEALDPLIKGWRSYAPHDRAVVLDALLGRREGTQALLVALSSGEIPARDVDAERRQRLLRSNSASVRERAEATFSHDAVDKDRRKTIDAYAAALDLAGDAAKGKPLFVKLCAGCHQLGGVGHPVGPDLAGLSDPSPSYLLTHVLDPNRAVESRYANYVVETTRGQTYSGVLAAEAGESVTILQANGVAATVARADLKAMRGTGLSLMPEGLEAGLSQQEMADLLAFAASGAPRPARKTFEGNEPALVRAGADGTLRLSPKSAEIYGPNVVLEERHGNLGFWSSAADHAAWTVEVPEAKTYAVWLDFACADDSAGNVLAVECGARRTTAKVPPTGDWDTYARKQFGTIDLKAGRQRLTVKPDGEPDGALIDLRVVELVPEKR